jgi:hypothetical protein
VLGPAIADMAALGRRGYENECIEMRFDVEVTVLEVECFDQTWSKITSSSGGCSSSRRRVSAKTGHYEGHYSVTTGAMHAEVAIQARCYRDRLLLLRHFCT